MALRALKTEEEIAGTPLDQPILIELPGGVVEEEKEVKKTEIEPDAKRLQEQLEAAQAAQRAETERAAKVEREANERIAKAERDATEARKHSAALEGDIITGGLAAAQAERDAAKTALQAAGEAGDWKAIADAQSRIGRAEAKILNFEAGAAEVAERKVVEPKEVKHEAQQPRDVNEAIDTNSSLLPAEKKWLKEHPDAYLPGLRNNELSVGYERAVKKGLVRGTDAYFDYLNEFMGYAKPEEERNNNVQAPPSRNERGSDGRPSGNRVTLTPEERDMAKSMGVSEIDYAKQKVRFEEARRADPERFR